MKPWHIIPMAIMCFIMFEIGFYLGKESVKKEYFLDKKEKKVIDTNDDYKYKEHCAGC